MGCEVRSMECGMIAAMPHPVVEMAWQPMPVRKLPYTGENGHAADLEIRGPTAWAPPVWRPAVRGWVKTRRDRGFSFRLDTKVVPEYPVKA